MQVRRQDQHDGVDLAAGRQLLGGTREHQDMLSGKVPSGLRVAPADGHQSRPGHVAAKQVTRVALSVDPETGEPDSETHP